MRFAVHDRADAESARMGQAATLDHVVGRRLSPLPLAEFLEALLRNDMGLAVELFVQSHAQGAQHERTRSFESGIQVDGADDGLVEVGEDRAGQAARVQATSQPRPPAKPQLGRRRRQGSARDQRGLGVRHLALGQIRISDEKFFGNEQVEDRISQELHALVVRSLVHGSVGEGELQELGIGEFVTQGRHVDRADSMKDWARRAQGGSIPARGRSIRPVLPLEPPMSESSAIHVQGLIRTYGANTAIDGLDLSVAPGECLGLLGPNGAGKTTTIKILSTALKPTEGHVRVLGLDPVDQAAALRGKIGVVPQEIALYDAMTARENLDFFGGMYGLTGGALQERTAWALDVAGLADRAEEYVKHYSGGMKRRLNLVASLLHEPAVVFLDEPTVGVDPQSRNHLFEVIEREIKGKSTLVYTTHQLGEVERLCDRIAILDNGRLVSQGTLPELQAAARAASGGSGLELEPGVDLEKAAGVLREAGFRVRVADGAPSLEDVFLALTGKALRDEA